MSKLPLAIVLGLALSFPFASQAEEPASPEAAAEQAAQEAAQDAVDEALEPMQKMSFLMGHIEADANSEDESLQAAAKAVLEANTEKEGIPALESYVNLKAGKLTEQDAEVLRGGYDAMIQMYAEEQSKSE